MLLVEDNPDDERLMIRALSMNGQRSHLAVARDGEEAIKLLHGEGNGTETVLRPALILLDLKLPKMNGLEVLKILRSDPRTSATPVVVLTMSDESKDIADSYRCGANSYVRKPVNFEQFIEALRQLEQYWLDTNLSVSYA